VAFEAERRNNSNSGIDTEYHGVLDENNLVKLSSAPARSQKPKLNVKDRVDGLIRSRRNRLQQGSGKEIRHTRQKE
jgi:hypothetical protein